MKKILSILLFVVMLTFTIILTSCDVAKIVLGVFDLVKEDNTNIDLDLNFGGSTTHIHVEGFLPGTESTCTTHGKSDGRYCLNCDVIFVPQEELPLKPHTYGKDGFCTECDSKKPSEGLEYELELEPGYYYSRLTGIGTCTGSKIVIADAYKGWPVKVIESHAFSGCSWLTSIEIPDSVATIGPGAFSVCSSLTSIEIPDSVTWIMAYAFCNCSSLTSIEIPDSVTYIEERTFEDCSSLTSIEIPDSVISIHSFVFEDCSSLTSIVIPDSVRSISEGVFLGCSSLTIYCEAETQPSEWDPDWNPDNRPVVWGYKPE